MPNIDLKRFRFHYNLTQRQLSEVTGVPLSTIESAEQTGTMAARTKQRLEEGISTFLAEMKKSPESLIYHTLTEALGGFGRYTLPEEREAIAKRLALALAGKL